MLAQSGLVGRDGRQDVPLGAGRTGGVPLVMVGGPTCMPARITSEGNSRRRFRTGG